MKSTHPSFQNTARWSAFAAGVVFLGTQFGCSKLMFWRDKPQAMHSGENVPAGQGSVRTSVGDNGNTEVAVRVKHLAPPSKVATDATVYVVWIQPKDGEKQNVGALTLNNNLEGSLDTVTPHKRFSVFVTPEASGQASQPTNGRVFTYEVESSK